MKWVNEINEIQKNSGAECLTNFILLSSYCLINFKNTFVWCTVPCKQFHVICKLLIQFTIFKSFHIWNFFVKTTMSLTRRPGTKIWSDTKTSVFHELLKAIFENIFSVKQLKSDKIWIQNLTGLRLTVNYSDFRKKLLWMKHIPQSKGSTGTNTYHL